MATENRILEMLALPPYTSNKMQPLDLAVFGLFKAYYNEEFGS